MTDEEGLSFAKWEREYVGHGYATTQWPGIETADNPWPPKPHPEERVEHYDWSPRKLEVLP